MFLFSSLINVFRFNGWKDSAKFILIPILKELLTPVLNGYFRAFRSLGISNIVVVVESGHNLYVIKSDLIGRWKATINSELTLQEIFPDKLKDMRGLSIRPLVGIQYPRIWKFNGEFRSADLDALKIIASARNSSVEPVEISTDSVGWFGRAIELLGQNVADLSVITSLQEVSQNLFCKFVETYDDNAYCALIPIPPRVPFLQYLLHPFDTISWILIFITIAGCGLVWACLCKDAWSTYNFVFNVIALFVNQANTCRYNRPMQNILFQICVLMAFILGNAYQSVIIAKMTQSREGHRYQTFAELFQSDFEFQVDRYFQFRLNTSGELSNLKRTKTFENNFDFLQASRNNSVIIDRCDVINFAHNIAMQYDTSNFYVLPDRIMPFLEKLYLGCGSPFREMLQMHYDLLFEAGIRQHLRKQVSIRKQAKLEREAQFLVKEEYLLGLKDFSGVFNIFVIGFGSATITFVAECACKVKWKQLLLSAIVKCLSYLK